MRVRITWHPKYPNGLSISFPYSESNVDTIKQVLGTNWNPKLKIWESEGPEVLLDFQRFGIEIEHISPEARKIAEEFRQQVWDTVDCRLLPVDEEPFAYQVQGAKFLAAMPNSILADDMGTGKSKQALDAGVLKGVENALIVCEKTTAFNWENEVKLWHPELTVGVVPQGVGVAARKKFWEDPPQIVIANYEQLWQSDWPFDIEWDAFIPDEATRFKSKTSQTWKAVNRVAKHSKNVWPLTGTPLEKNLGELFNIMAALRPAVLGNYNRFREQHMELDWKGNVVAVKNLEILRERIGAFMLRRTKEEVQKWLPPKQYQEIFIPLSMPEKAAYEAFTDEFNNWLTQHGVSGGGDPMVQTIRARQFCCTPMLFTDDLGMGSKFEATQGIVEQWPGRIVIFCFFKEVINLLMKHLDTVHPEALISGDIDDAKERFRRTQAFNNGDLGKIFLSTDAGNRGINLTGADLCIHYDQIHNAQKMHQREDRLHRTGQTGHVHVMHMMCIDTIDYGIYLNNKEEAKLFEEVINGAEEQVLRKLNAPRLRNMMVGRL